MQRKKDAKIKSVMQDELTPEEYEEVLGGTDGKLIGHGFVDNADRTS